MLEATHHGGNGMMEGLGQVVSIGRKQRERGGRAATGRKQREADADSQFDSPSLQSGAPAREQYHSQHKSLLLREPNLDTLSTVPSARQYCN